MQNVSKRVSYDYANMYAAGYTFITHSNCNDANDFLKN